MDRSHTAHRLQTTMNSGQETIAVYLRRHFLLSLDDLLAVAREFLCPKVSRSGLDRCLRRHGLGNLRDLLPKETKAPRKTFKAYEPGFLHLDVKYPASMRVSVARGTNLAQRANLARAIAAGKGTDKPGIAHRDMCPSSPPGSQLTK
jgi:hypothetical protein